MLNPARFAEKSAVHHERRTALFSIFVRKVIHLKKITTKSADSITYQSLKPVEHGKTI